MAIGAPSSPAPVDESPLLIDFLPTMAWTAAPDGSVDFVNQQCSAFTGLSREQLLGSGLSDCFHPDDRPLREKAKTRLNEGRPFESEFRLRRHDGTYARCVTRAVPVHDSSGRLIKWVGTTTDVESIRSAADDLKLQDEHLQLALESADVGIWRLKLPNYDLSADDRTRRHLDLDRNEIIGYRPQDHIHPQDFERAQAMQTPSHDGRYVTEHRVRQRDGGYRWQAIHWRIYFDGGAANPEAGLITGTSMDITARKQAEAEREELGRRYRMALRLALALAAATLPLTLAPLPAVAQEQPAATEGERLNAWFEEKFEQLLRFSPSWLTSLGRRERYGDLNDFSEAAADWQLAWYKASVEEMEREFDYAELGPEERLSYDLWKYEYESAVRSAKWRGNDYVFTQMQGVHAYLPTQLITEHAVESPTDMAAYISRVGQFERALGQLTDRAEANAVRGVRPPYFAYDFVIAEAKKLIDGAPFTDGADTALWADGKAKIAALAEAGKIDGTEAQDLRTRLESALRNSYLPGYQRLIAFMEADRPNAPEVATGVGRLPDGAAFYADRLRESTTSEMTADEIHQLGLDEVARIHGEMNVIKDRVDFDGDLNAFFDYVRTAEWDYFPDDDAGAQAYLDATTAVIDNIKGQLPSYFGLLPKAALEVRRVEPFREQDGGAAHYRSGTPDGSRPGIYYMHLSDMRAMPKNDLETTAYHEALPGHHMQISIAQELTGVPTFRTQFGYGAYAEGWALYSEKLAKEMPGTFADPYSDFGRLVAELFRAIRLVVDTGLHSKGWTEAEAIAYFSANSSIPAETIRSEVRRYIVWPGQATSYKVGMIRIQQLRAEAERELGDQFDIRAFHDVVLGGGSLPLSLLERRVRGWIAEQKGG